MKLPLSLSALAFAMAIPAPVLAAASSDQTEHMIITASRTARSVDDTLAPVTVITRADIDRQQVRTLPELLRGMPGISIANNGGRGKNTAIFLRGSESDHVLILIDGVKVGSATAGTAAIQNIPLDQVERIEVVRGPRSSLYGSEAIGGVIQIFTRGNQGAGVHGNGEIWGGSFGTVGSSAAIQASNGAGWINLSGSAEHTDGYNACQPNLSAGCYADEPDKDGNDTLGGQLRGGYRFSDRASIELNIQRVDTDTEFDGGFTNETSSSEQTFSAMGRFEPISGWNSSLLLADSRDENDNYHDGVFSSTFDTKRQLASWQNDWTLRGQDLLTLGADWQKDQVASTTDYDQTSRHNLGVFTQYLLQLGVHDFELSLRNDDNQQYGNHNTGSLAWGAPLADGLRVVASYGTAFKAPTFNELYYPGYGNPDLQPEESSTVEFGLRGEQKVNWSASVYQTDVDQLIGYDSSTWAPANIDEARLRGLELAATTQLGNWTLGAWATLLDSDNRSSSYDGKRLPRRSAQSARFDADYQWGIWSLGGSWLLEGDRYDDLGNNVRLAGYGLLDLRGSVELGSAWSLLLRVGNLLDKEYETAAWYNQPERNATLTLRYQP